MFFNEFWAGLKIVIFQPSLQCSTTHNMKQRTTRTQNNNSSSRSCALKAEIAHITNSCSSAMLFSLRLINSEFARRSPRKHIAIARVVKPTVVKAHGQTRNDLPSTLVND